MIHTTKITIKFDMLEITLRMYFDENTNYGGIVSYEDEHCCSRAFLNRYDKKEFKTLSEYNKAVKYYSKKAISK